MEIWVALVGLAGSLAVALIARFPAARRDDRLRESIARDVELLEKLKDPAARAAHQEHIAARLGELRELRARRTPASDALMTLGSVALGAGWLLGVVALLIAGDVPSAKAAAVNMLWTLAVVAAFIGTVTTLGVYCWHAFGWVKRLTMCVSTMLPRWRPRRRVA